MKCGKVCMARASYEGIDKLLYSCGEAADKLGIHRDVLLALSKQHPVYMPQKRHNGLKRPVYSNHQLAAIKQVLLGNFPPDAAYQAYRQAERNEANRLYRELVTSNNPDFCEWIGRADK